MNPEELNDGVLSDIMNNMDTEDPEDLRHLSAEEAFDRFLTWNGIIGYTGIIMEALDNIRKACAGEDEKVELLRSAHAIARRRGENTDWERFAASIQAIGIGSVTPRTYRILEASRCTVADGKPTLHTGVDTLIRCNLMEQPGYSPYCGSMACRHMPRTRFDGEQFVCPACGWRSQFPEDFISEYKTKWGLP